LSDLQVVKDLNT